VNVPTADLHAPLVLSCTSIVPVILVPRRLTLPKRFT
jgi:hypothetical protein